MKRTKDIYAELQQQGFDIDCNGGMLEDQPVLNILHTERGKFYKASINCHPVTESQLMEILDIKFKGNEFANTINNYVDNNPNEYIYNICEKNIS